MNKSIPEKTTITSTYIGHVIGASFGLVFVLVNSAPFLPALRIVACILAVAVFVVVVGFITSPRTATPG